MKAKLKTCPFCGKGAKMVLNPDTDMGPVYYATCPKCLTVKTDWFRREEDAEKAWNRRAK